MRHFRVSQPLYKTPQNKFPNTLPTQDTLQINQNKPVREIETQQVQIHQPTKSSYSQNKDMYHTPRQDLCQQANVPNQVPKLDTPNLQGEQVHQKKNTKQITPLLQDTTPNIKQILCSMLKNTNNPSAKTNPYITRENHSDLQDSVITI